MEPSEAPCRGESFLHWQNADDGDWRVQIECNGGADGDCGWFLPLDLASTDGLNTQELRQYEEVHELHRASQVTT